MKADLSSAQFYTQLDGLGKIKAQANKNPHQTLTEAAKQFESLFLNMMLKNMRKANDMIAEGNYLNSREEKFFRDMLDSQLAIEMAQSKGIGLADQIIKQMKPLLQAQTDSDAVSELPEEKRLDTINNAEIINSSNTSREDNPAVKSQKSEDVVSGSQALNSILGKEESVEKAAISAKPISIPEIFDSPATFIKSLYPIAEKVASAVGIDPRFMLAQAALETGWGKHMIRQADGSNSHNLFGIKAHKRWQGDKANIATTEFRQGVAVRERADFRAYDSYEASMQDYVDFLQQNPRYKQALSVKQNPEQFLLELQKAGYATDPRYAKKIINIANSQVMSQASLQG
ncbi:flagellar assembly peptidoglycan hydrolase FlgJ [Zooshikella marina]|uniref:flagellar assembly peptidoglycan hydrolase FlgJ n=1 Tax=Zooshikella ganghwensis TaxID=202772 RepID=UPI001BB0D4BD|nr:flagellar assembly peptidoglycan hydrolase FlgJ [Zooshikella ganghwensis]MBU2704568.1 flagellar assembly peptidoglycan hydrolase FlgJ [Zooshikella ganghwensis]